MKSSVIVLKKFNLKPLIKAALTSDATSWTDVAVKNAPSPSPATHRSPLAVRSNCVCQQGPRS